jgi:hypothetical protein
MGLLEKDGEVQLALSCIKGRSVARVKGEWDILHEMKGRGLTGLVTSYVGTAF